MIQKIKEFNEELRSSSSPIKQEWDYDEKLESENKLEWHDFDRPNSQIADYAIVSASLTTRRTSYGSMDYLERPISKMKPQQINQVEERHNDKEITQGPRKLDGEYSNGGNDERKNSALSIYTQDKD